MTTGLKVYLSNTASQGLDVNSPEVQASKALEETQPGSSTQLGVTMDVTTPIASWYFFTKANVPNNAAWETGNWSIPVNITDALSRCQVKVRLHLIDIDAGISGGFAIIESSAYSSEQGTGTTGVKTFTFTAEPWTASNDATDRLMIEVFFTKGIDDGFVGFTVGDANVCLTPLTRPHTVAPTAVVASATAPASANTAASTVAPTAASAAATAPAPGQSTAATAIAAAAIALAVIASPAVAAASTVATTPATASAIAAPPQVDAPATVAPVAALATAVAPSPALDGAATVAAASAVATAVAPAPAISAEATVGALPAVATAQVPAPAATVAATVQAGSAVASAVALIQRVNTAATAQVAPAVATAQIGSPQIAALVSLQVTAAIASAVATTPSIQSAATVLAGSAIASAVVPGPAIDLEDLAGCIEALLNTVRGRFETTVELPEPIATVYDNEPPEDLGGADAWLRLSAEVTPSEQLDFSGTGHQPTRLFGKARAHVYLRLGVGDAAAWELADAINDAFRAVTADGVIYSPPPHAMLRGRRGEHWCLEVVIPFYADCVAGALA